MARKSTVSTKRKDGEQTLDKVRRLEFTAATKRAAWERAGGRCEGWEVEIIRQRWEAKLYPLHRSYRNRLFPL